MEKDAGRRHVCEPHCKYYKPGRKEDLKCGALQFLSRNLSRGELGHVSRGTGPLDFSRDEDIRALACSRCEFLVDGCDYRDGVQAPPCGAYSVVERMLKKHSPKKK